MQRESNDVKIIVNEGLLSPYYYSWYLDFGCLTLRHKSLPPLQADFILCFLSSHCVLFLSTQQAQFSWLPSLSLRTSFLTLIQMWLGECRQQGAQLQRF